MSVWSNPSYAIEPLRLAANNLPKTCRDEFPIELHGIANFKFGKCSKRHQEKAERMANDYFIENPEAWRDFFDSGRRNLQGTNAVCFRNTLRQTNCKFAGLRAVYWAFEKFRTETWEPKKTFEEEDLKKFVGTAFKLGSPPSRINEQTWDHAQSFYEAETRGETSWSKRESIADSVEFLWASKTATNLRKIRHKTNTLFESSIRTKIKKVGTDPDAKDKAVNEGKRYSSLRVKPFDDSAARSAYAAVRSLVKKGEKVSKNDANAIAILPYVCVPVRSGRLVSFMFRGGLILYDKLDKTSGFYTSKEWDRLVQMLKSDAKLTMYFSKYDPGEVELSKLMIDTYEKIMSQFFRSLDPNDGGKCNTYCRAYDVYSFVFLAELASDINENSLDDQHEKVHDENLNDLVGMDEFLEYIDNPAFGVKESLELLKFNKIFPCPDFCIYSVCDNLEAKADDTHTIEDHKVLGVNDAGDVVASFTEFEAYMKRNRALNYFDVHGCFPGELINSDEVPINMMSYPSISRHALRVSDMAHINIEGTFHYRSFDGCEDELVKDKVIAPTVEKEDKRELKEISHVEKNQIMKFIFSSKFKSQADVFKMAQDGTLFTKWKHWIFLALKPEAKKPDSRAFSMAMDEYRRFLSEFEWNVSYYAKKQSGSSVGKSTIDLDSRLGQLAATPLTEYIDGKAFKPVIISFDLKGFSPQQNPKFKELGVCGWSHAFGKPELKEVLKLFTGAQMTFAKFDVNDNFISRGNDLEGFQGKMNTSTHIDLMGYAVSKLKELGYTVGKSSLEVLIDDGLLRVHLELSDKRVQSAISIIDEVYKFAGQKISWDKTFCSRVLCQYLNRVYYDGIEVTPGSKAFLRIGKKQEAAIPTVADELMAHSAATRGAIQNGSHHMLAYYAYFVEVYKTLRRWGCKAKTDEEILRVCFSLYVPIGLGGFGISTLYGLSTNESFNAMQSGISAMKLIVHRYKGFRALANTYLNAGMRTMSEESILRNPMALRTNNRCLNLRRFANAAKHIVIKKSTNALIQRAARGVFDGMEQDIVKELMRTRVISEVKRVLLWDMTIQSYIESIVGKLQTSQTAARVLGFRKALRIQVANKSECRTLLKEIAAGRVAKRAF